MTYSRLCQEKKTYSHTQHHISIQRQKSGGPSQGCANAADSQSRRRSKIASEIIIKEGRIRKVEKWDSLIETGREKRGRRTFQKKDLLERLDFRGIWGDENS